MDVDGEAAALPVVRETGEMERIMDDVDECEVVEKSVAEVDEGTMPPPLGRPETAVDRDPVGGGELGGEKESGGEA